MFTSVTKTVRDSARFSDRDVNVSRDTLRKKPPIEYSYKNNISDN